MLCLATVLPPPAVFCMFTVMVSGLFFPLGASLLSPQPPPPRSRAVFGTWMVLKYYLWMNERLGEWMINYLIHKTQ